MYCMNYYGKECSYLCPNALFGIYPEYVGEETTCFECPYNEGCADCVFYGTSLCEPIDEKGEKMILKTIKIKYVKEGMEKINPISSGDWIDLRVAEDITMRPGEFRLIPLGVAMKLPEGYEAIVAPRSSTFNKYGILQSNSIGVIDESYCGNSDEWLFPAYATQHTHIPKNTRICQFRIFAHQPLVGMEEVTELSGNSRGGFGSTGER